MAGDMNVGLDKLFFWFVTETSFDRKFNRNASATVKSVTTPGDVWRFQSRNVVVIDVATSHPTNQSPSEGL